jgi:large subunit ribosomal protein L21
MAYAIVKLGGKQYRVREGERIVVDRLPHDENATFEPDVLMIGGDGSTELAPGGVTVTARILEHGRGPKIRIGKYKAKSGYKKHTGFRAATSQVIIESIGAGKPKKAAAKPKAEEPKAEEKTEDTTAAAPEAPAAQTPAEETPAEETPAEETPAEETPAEKTEA